MRQIGLDSPSPLLLSSLSSSSDSPSPTPEPLMQALRLARPRLPLRTPARAFAAAAHAAPAASTSSSSGPTVVPLSNVEAMWERLSADEQLVIHQQLEEIQKKDWKTLSVDEKKAGTLRRRACPRPVSLSSTPMSPFC